MIFSRKPLLALGAVVVLAALGTLMVKGIQLTLLLKHQVALVFESSAMGEARANMANLERVIRSREESAFRALEDLPFPASEEEIVEATRRHPIIRTPFLLAADLTLAYPPVPAPPLAAMAEGDLPPEDFLRARRLASSRGSEEQAMVALEEVASTPALARPWRLRARAAIAAAHLRAGRPNEAAAAYAAIETDFAQELGQMVQPSRAQLVAARAMSLDQAGRRAEGQSLLVSTLRNSLGSGLASPGVDDLSLLLERASLLFGEPGDPEFSSQLEPLLLTHANRVQAERLARTVREWIVPRLLLGGEPEPFVAETAPRRSLIAWDRTGKESGLAAVGILLDPLVVLEVLQEAHDGGSPLALQIRRAPDTVEFHVLRALPGVFEEFKIGLDRSSWEQHLGNARQPFDIALAMIVALGIFLAIAIGLGALAIRREMALARMKTNFVANVSHDLKTPLALIRLFGETLLLGRVRDPTKIREYHQIICRESERLTHLVNNVLDFSSIEAGQKRFDLQPCDLGHVVRETLAGYRLQLEENGVQVNQSIAKDLPVTRADRDGVAQALLNLLDNAVKYGTDKKVIDLEVKSSSRTIRVSVTDQGMGIPTGEQSQVFKTFYRSPAARQIGTRGSGLGLALVKHILDAHGGRVELKSAPGKGSTFTLVFPVNFSPGLSGNEEETTGNEERRT